MADTNLEITQCVYRLDYPVKPERHVEIYKNLREKCKINRFIKIVNVTC